LTFVNSDFPSAWKFDAQLNLSSPEEVQEVLFPATSGGSLALGFTLKPAPFSF
jgi:hypothetical protein